MFSHFKILNATLLLTRIDFNRSMDNYFNALESMEWNYISIPKHRRRSSLYYENG